MDQQKKSDESLDNQLVENEQDVQEMGEIDIEPKRKFQISKDPLYSGVMNSNSAGGGKKILILLSLAVAILFAVSFYFLKGKSTVKPQSSPSPSPQIEITFDSSPSPTPVLTSTPSFSRSKYIIRVLNGTDKIGLAGSTSARLKELGYSIDKTGNASTSAQTLIRVKSGLSDLLKQLIKDLSPDFAALEDKTLLKDEDSASAEVILGKDRL